jgi:hypothetical protein
MAFSTADRTLKRFFSERLTTTEKHVSIVSIFLVENVVLDDNGVKVRKFELLCGANFFAIGNNCIQLIEIIEPAKLQEIRS